MNYEEITAILDTIPEIEESKQYYTDCLDAVNGLIHAIDEKVEFIESEDENVRNDYDLYKLKLERCDLISRQKAYESYLKEKIAALVRNHGIQKELESECEQHFHNTLELVNKSKLHKLKQELSVTDIQNLTKEEKIQVYLKMKLALL